MKNVDNKTRNKMTYGDVVYIRTWAIAITIGIVILVTYFAVPVCAWYDGGISTDPNNPRYGQHDFILQRAIDMLPNETKRKIDIISAYYGTEIPDCVTGIYCINDQRNHSVYYYANGSVQRDRAATRSQQEYNLAKSYLQNGDIYNFSLHVGAMSHYIDDLSVFVHTMSYGTDWGPAVHEAEYEQYAEQHLDLWDTHFDNKFERILAYDAALKVARETTFDSGIYTNVWINRNYNWSDPNFVLRTKVLINYSVNIIADVIYTMADTDPSASITALKNEKRGNTYIDWKWKDPTNVDFEKVMIYINGEFKTNVSKRIQHYSARDLRRDATYRISTRTVDVNGNVNSTWVNRTDKTKK